MLRLLHYRRGRRAVRIGMAAILAAATTLVVAAPASAHPVLTVTASPTTVYAGQNVTITVSGTSNGNYTGARIDVSAVSGTGGTTGSLPSYTTFVSCGGGVTCSEVGSVYRMALPNLTNNQAFSYTITLTVDAGTSPGTFTSRGQFYKSDNTTDGPKNGSVVTVLAPSDLSLVPYGSGISGGELDNLFDVHNAGPGAATSATISITIDRSGVGTLARVEDGIEAFSCSGTTGVDATCTLTTTFNPSDEAYIDHVIGLNLLALGTYVITNTISSPTDINTSNNTLVTTCTLVTSLIGTCSQA